MKTNTLEYFPSSKLCKAQSCFERFDSISDNTIHVDIVEGTKTSFWSSAVYQR